MKVHSSNSNSVERTKDSVPLSKTSERESSASRKKPGMYESGNSSYEKVNISDNAKVAARAKDLATSAPDVREERVEKLREAIKNGSYKIDTDAVAEKLLSEHLQST